MKTKLFIIIAVCVVVCIGLSVTAYSGTTTGKAYKTNLGLFLKGIPLDHTYFCTSGSSNCYSIKYYGGQETCCPTGTLTSGSLDDKHRCAAQSRGRMDWSTLCGMTYAVTGVCHQHANRGAYSWGGAINPNNLRGGSLSFSLYGAYGTYWGNCKSLSNSACGL